MYKIVGLDLKNVGNFNNISVDFRDPLTYVRGVNKDTGLSARTTGNGVGKSLLFSCVANLRFGSAPSATRKNNRKEILSSKAGSIGLALNDLHGNEFEIIQKASGYTIFKNGEDLGVRRIDRQQEFIRSLLPISEIDFYTREFISTQRPYPMRVASNDLRLQHMVDLHRLDQYSAIKEYFSVRAASMRDDELRVGVLEQTLVDLDKKITDATKNLISEAVFKSNSAKLEAVESEVSSFAAKKSKLISKISTLSALVALSTQLKDKKKRLTTDKTTEELKSLRKAASKWEDFDFEYARYKKDSAKIEGELAELPESSYSKSDLRKKISGLEESVASLKKALRTHDTRKEEHDALYAAYKEARAANEKFDFKVDPDRDYSEELAVLNTALRLAPLLEHEHSSDGTCPTCMSAIDYSKIKSLVEDARAKIPKVKRKIQAQKALAAFKDARDDLDAHTYSEDQHAADKDRYDRDKKNLDKLEISLSVVERRELLTRKLAAVEKPVKPSCAKPEMSTSEINDAIDALHAVEKIEAEIRSLMKSASIDSFEFKAQNDALEKEAADLDERLDYLNKKKAKYSDVVLKYKSAKDVLDVYVTEKKGVEKKLGGLRENTKDKKLVNILVKCYGPKGLRSKAASSVCRLLEDNLNQYRDLLFYEPFIFFVESTDAGVSISVDRNNGSATAVTDVRNLSGAESNAFDMLFCLADLMVTPSHMKTDMLVLDEPTCHMDEVTRVLFNERFLPAVQELVPHTYVITPNADDYRPGSSEWVVHKERGVSTVLTNCK